MKKVMWFLFFLCVLVGPRPLQAMDMSALFAALAAVDGMGAKNLARPQRDAVRLRHILGNPTVVINEDMQQIKGEAPLPDGESIESVVARLLEFLTEQENSRVLWHDGHPDKFPGLMFQIIYTRQDLAKIGYGCRAALCSALRAPQVELFEARLRVELLTTLVEVGYKRSYRAAVLLAEEFCKRPEVPVGHVPVYFVKLLLEELLKREEELREWGPVRLEGRAPDAGSCEYSADELFDGKNIIDRARAALEHPRLQSPQ